MSNSYFQFKQFRIEQGNCAMKVTTDACIQGAWTPLLPNVRRVLDIGAGTGLLSLLLAQRRPGLVIDALEIDAAAVVQANNNLMASKWKDTLQVIEADARNYTAALKYDMIISNPPFFINSLLSCSDSRNLARHTRSLSSNDLLATINNNLCEGGYASILLPTAEYNLFEVSMMEAGWYEWERLSVKHTASSAAKRIVAIISKSKPVLKVAHELIIKNERQYTSAFIQLLSPFYLAL
jgi:tRNA1Val (adenine37-N6)-methyltransferase